LIDKNGMNRKEFLKSGTLAVAAIGTAQALTSWIPRNIEPVSALKQIPHWIPRGGRTVAQLNAIVEKYYGDPDDVSAVGRARKMQALIMELAIRAKTPNPHFQVVPQDTLEFAHVDGNPNNRYDKNFIDLLDGWGIEDFSAATVKRLANLTKLGIKGTANTNGSTVQIVTRNQKIAAENNILWHPRLSAEVYQSPGIGHPGYMPIYSPSSNAYNIIHDPIPAGVAATLNSNNVFKMMDAKNHLYMISSSKYSNWPAWESNPYPRLDITNTAGYLVPFAGGRFKPTGTASVVAQAIKDHGTEWDFFWVAKGYKQNEGRKAYIEDLSASEWDAFYIDAHFDGAALTQDELQKLKWKPQGGRRQVIAYLSIGTTEFSRWYVDPSMMNTNPKSFRHGAVTSGKFIPARERFPNISVPSWILWPAYSGQYADECTPIWWHPEWRDIIVRGGSPYKNPQDHSLFAKGRSSIDRIVDMGFDGVYLDNVSRATTSAASWTALQNYNQAHPKWYLKP
jgi:endo-alpha-1,4-polygalactosaminidase (GH114 family)